MTGRTPRPIANADPAWKPRLHIRCFHACVTTAYSCEESLISWFTTTSAPRPSSATPAWSRRLHPCRRRLLVGPARKRTIAATA
jgi:hypothetical protein